MAVSQDTLKRIHQAVATAKLRAQMYLESDIYPRLHVNDVMELVGELALTEMKLKLMLALALECGADEGVDTILELSVDDLPKEEGDPPSPRMAWLLKTDEAE